VSAVVRCRRRHAEDAEKMPLMMAKAARVRDIYDNLANLRSIRDDDVLRWNAAA